MNLLAPFKCFVCSERVLLTPLEVAELRDRGEFHCEGCDGYRDWEEVRPVIFLPDGDFDRAREAVVFNAQGKLERVEWAPRVP